MQRKLSLLHLYRGCIMVHHWTCASYLVCVSACTHACVCIYVWLSVCVCTYVCVQVLVCIEFTSWVLAYSPAHLGGEDLQFWSCCVNTHSRLFSTSIPKVLPGGFSCIKHSSVIPFPYMEFPCIFIIPLSIITVHWGSGTIINTACILSVYVCHSILAIQLQL